MTRLSSLSYRAGQLVLALLAVVALAGAAADGEPDPSVPRLADHLDRMSLLRQ